MIHNFFNPQCYIPLAVDDPEPLSPYICRNNVGTLLSARYFRFFGTKGFGYIRGWLGFCDFCVLLAWKLLRTRCSSSASRVRWGSTSFACGRLFTSWSPPSISRILDCIFLRSYRASLWSLNSAKRVGSVNRFADSQELGNLSDLSAY